MLWDCVNVQVRIKMKVLGESDGPAMPGGLIKYKLEVLLDQPPGFGSTLGATNAASFQDFLSYSYLHTMK